MAAAYAALVSLLNTMDQIQIHPILSTSFNNYPNQPLRKKIDFFVDFVESYSDADNEAAEDLVRQIAVVAHEAEDIIENQAAYRILSGSTRKSLKMPRKLRKILEEMDSIKVKVIKLKEEIGFLNSMPPASSSAPDATAEAIATATVENYSDADSEDLVRQMAVVAVEPQDITQIQAAAAAPIREESPSFLPDQQKRIKEVDFIKVKELDYKSSAHSPSSSSSASAAPSAISKTTTNTIVGFDGYVEQLLDQLTGDHSGRQIIPIVGMGGIGKTTLVKTVYQNSVTEYHFNVLAWVTVSQQSSAREILLQALSGLKISTDEMDRKTDDQLGEELHKILYGRRYLIVLDDVWSVEAWDKIKFFFPENNNGSRIVVTTRLSNLVAHFNSSIVLNFLDDKNSWELFCEKTFAQQGCPPELEEVGKRIVNKCNGLPLAIVVIGGLLGKSPRMPEYWEKIAKDISSNFNSEGDDEVLSILKLSYTHLPVRLKPCFLYLGSYPEDYEINVSQLIKLWVAEGFIKADRDKSLEEVAKSNIEELANRNLLLVSRLRRNKKVDRCQVHDLVRDLCIRIAEKDKFFCVQRDIDGTHHYIADQTTARFHHRDSHTCETPSLVSPLIFEGQIQTPFKSRLLRVLVRDVDHLDSSLREVNLRLLFTRFHRKDTYKLPSSISLLWSLQTLIIEPSEAATEIVAPTEIWKMPQLRHIDVWSIYIPDPPPSDEVFALLNLQTLKTVVNLNLSEEVCKRIPNIKELEIRYEFQKQGGEASSYHLHNVGCLHKLESLDYYNDQRDYLSGSLQNLKLPSSLKKLVLEKCGFEWSDMTMIGSLPHLEHLELGRDATIGPDWISVEEEFLSLKYLSIDSCDDLINWTANTFSFPVLESLFLGFLPRLDEIPSIIAERWTLETMIIHCCSQSACISAIKILEEQQSFGNQDLRLQVVCGSKTEAEKLREEHTCENLLITFTPGNSQAHARSYYLDFHGKDYTIPAIVQSPDSSSEKQSRRFSEIYEVQEKSHSYLEGNPGTEILREESSDLLDADIDSSECQSEQRFGDEITAEGLTLIQEDSETETEMFRDSLSIFDSQKIVEPECHGEIQVVDELTTETDAEKFLGEQRGTERRSEHHEEGISFQEKDPYLVIKEDNHLQLKLDNMQTIVIVDNPDFSLANAMLNLADQDLRELPENPNYHNPLLLFLQRNRRLSLIHPSFFDIMPDLQFLDLSDTKIRILPSSLFKLSKLKVLLLRNCMCLDSLPHEIGRLNQLEALDLSGAELYDLPDEIGQLVLLKSMHLSFYGPDDESEYDHLPSRLVSPTFLSELKEIQALSISVHPEDHRWAEIVECITNDVSKLERLSYLQFYFPQEKMFETFIETSPSWEKQKVSRFDFIVGQNVKRIASRVPDEVDSLFNQHERCLRYVNGDGAVSRLFKSVLTRVSAFYLDHHTEVQSLSEFDVSNFKALKFCVVRECPRIQTILDEKNVVGAFPCLEQLQIYFLWELKLIWQPPSLGRLKRIFRTPRPYDNFKALRCLIINTCPKLQFIFFESMLQCLTSLEELVVEDCERVEKIIKEEKKKVKYEDNVLPRLRKLVLHYLPELVSVGNSVCLSEEKINVYGCPKFDLQLSISKSLPMKSLVEE